MQIEKLHTALKYYMLPTLLVVSQSVFAAGIFIPRPSPGLIANADKGKILFQENCARCHGVDLKGTDQGPPMLHRVYLASHHSDAAFQLAVKNGVMPHHWPFGKMPAVPTLTADDVAHIIAYVRGEQFKAGIK